MKPNTVGRAVAPSRAPHPQPPQTPQDGLPGGTIILTMDGEMPVEFLEPGDRIITRDSGVARLVALDRLRLQTRRILITAGSLGDTRPESDLVLPAAQPVLLRDWRAQALCGRAQALAPAGALVDGEFVLDLGPGRMDLHRLRFDAPHVIYAGGLELAAAAPRPALRPAA